MTVLELQALTAQYSGAEAFHGGLFRRVLMSVKRWHCRRQTLARLSALSERQLVDMGVEPADIPLRHNSMWEKPHSRPDIR